MVRENVSGPARRAEDPGGPRAGVGLLVGYHFWTDLLTLIVAARKNISSQAEVTRNGRRHVRHQVI